MNNNTAYIAGISYYLPLNILSNEDISREHPEWSIDKIAKKTGIEERRITGENELASDLAFEAAKKLFNECNIDKNIIDFVLLCTQSPDYFLPTTACILQKRLNLSTNCGALDFNLGCSGYIYGLALAKGLIMSGTANNVLLITAETYSKYINSNDKSNKTLFGDAAAATLISSQFGKLEIGHITCGSDGGGAQNLIVPNGAGRHHKDGSLNDYLYMNGSEIFKFTSEKVPQLVERLLNSANLTKDDITLFVFHQANRYMLDFIRKKIDIPSESFFYHLQKTGNTVSSTIPIALKEALEISKIAPQSNLLLAGFGVGYSWGAAIIKTK